jgi:pimeloyl-ACP methyl ester carboxylesterase
MQVSPIILKREVIMQRPRIKVGEIELQVQDYEKDGEAIVFLHFGGGNLMMWQPVVPYFQLQYRLVLIDLRGHGRSDKPQVGYHIDDMARDVVGVMQGLQLERAHIVGSSLGAEVGLSLAAHDPQKVLSLVCDGALSSEYGPYGVWQGSEASFKEYVEGVMQGMRSAPEKLFPSVEAFIEHARLAFEKSGWWNDSFAGLYRYDACRTGDGQYSRSWSKPAQLEYMQFYFAARFEDYYRQVQCPLLMVPSAADFEDEHQLSAMTGLSRLANRATIVPVPGWIHPYGWLLDPADMCKVVLDFVGNAGGKI